MSERRKETMKDKRRYVVKVAEVTNRYYEVYAQSDREALNFVKLDNKGKEYLVETEPVTYRVITPDDENDKGI
jgi:hypothetical protein